MPITLNQITSDFILFEEKYPTASDFITEFNEFVVLRGYENDDWYQNLNFEEIYFILFENFAGKIFNFYDINLALIKFKMKLILECQTLYLRLTLFDKGKGVLDDGAKGKTTVTINDDLLVIPTNVESQAPSYDIESGDRSSSKTLNRNTSINEYDNGFSTKARLSILKNVNKAALTKDFVNAIDYLFIIHDESVFIR